MTKMKDEYAKRIIALAADSDKGTKAVNVHK